MDPNNIEKLKQDFILKQENSMLKAKEIQRETLNRKKTMEMKARLEAAKEEKRRQEALAERRAHHIEATMRFQKGLKHFKFSKEHISLEQVLREISPQSRKDSNSSLTRKNSSFDNLNNSNMSISTINTNQASARRANSVGSTGKHIVKRPAISTPVGNKPIVVNNQQNFNPYKAGFLSDNTDLDKKLGRHEEFFDQNNNVYVTDFKEILEENQKNIQDLNKEALKEFENLVSNQINHESQEDLKAKFESYNNSLLYGQKGSETNNTKTLKKKVLENNYIAYEADNRLYKTDLKKPVSNFNRLDSNGSVDSDMDTDSLVNENIVVTQFDNQSGQYEVCSKQTQESQPFNSNNWFKKIENVQLNHYNNNVDNNSDEPMPELVSYNSQHGKVKSILKRTTSGTENDLAIVGFTPSVNFGIDSRTNVRDSIAVANQRLGKTSKLDESNGEKKNVRFATNLVSENVIRIPSAGKIDETPASTPSIQPSNLNSLHTKTIQNLVIEKPQQTLFDPSGPNVVISRRPVIKPKLSTAQQQMKKASIYDAAGITPPPVHPRQNEVIKYESTSTTPSTPNYSSTPIIEKPPTYPNTVSPASATSTPSINNGSYALLGQRRKEHLQARILLKNQTTATRINSPKIVQQPVLVTTTTTRLNSPKSSQTQQQTNGTTSATTNALKIDISPNIGLQHHLNSNYSSNSTNNHTSTPNNNGFVLPSNRAPIQSPIQSPSPYFPIPVLNQSATASPQVNYSTNINNNSTLNATPLSVNPSNNTNLKNAENNYRELQKRKSESTTSTITLPLFNVFGKNGPANGSITKTPENTVNRPATSDTPIKEADSSNNGGLVQATTYKNGNVSFTKIPLSPKSTLIKANPFLKETSDITSESIRRPNSMPNTITNHTSNFNRANGNNVTVTTPVATPITATMTPITNSTVQNQVPKTNIRFAYMNSNVNNNSTTVNLNQQRIWSAESSVGNGLSSQVPQPSHLSSFPLFSNYQQNQHNNKRHTENTPAVIPTHSLAAFEAAEEMCVNDFTEAQIKSTVNTIVTTKNMPVSLSIEEQNVKNSILRLNERLNALTNRRFSNTSNDYEDNRYKSNNNKPVEATLTAKSRR